jgi:hypothetical protein
VSAPGIIPAAEAQALLDSIPVPIELRLAAPVLAETIVVLLGLAAKAPDLAASVVALHGEVEHLRRVVALERADESAALPGWRWNPHAQYWYSDDGWGIWRSQTASWSAWLGRIKRDYRDDCPLDLHTSKSFPTVWDAMSATRGTP